MDGEDIILIVLQSKTYIMFLYIRPFFYIRPFVCNIHNNSMSSPQTTGAFLLKYKYRSKNKISEAHQEKININLLYMYIVGITFIMYIQNRKIGKPNNFKFLEQ